MSPGGAIQVVILCEDKQHETFCRRFLKTFGFDLRTVTVERVGNGQGAADDWVLKRYPIELAAHRRHGSPTQKTLIVMLDADGRTGSERRAQLLRACADRDERERESDERVVFAIPRRTIESWIAYLDDGQVDESKPYPKLRRESDCWPMVDKLAEACRSRDPLPDAPEELQATCLEFRARLLPGSSGR